MEIQTIKKIEKAALKENGTDLTRLGFALFLWLRFLLIVF